MHSYTSHWPTRRSALVLALLCATLGAGCGLIADKDRIRIAKVDDTYITRGDLHKLISEMEPIPNVQNKGDLLRIIRQHIDGTLKQLLAETLAKDGKITVERAVASAVYDQEHPDEVAFGKIATDNNPQLDTFLKDYNMTLADLTAMKNRREEGIDKVADRLLADAALEYQVTQDAKSGALTVTDAEYETEFNLRKGELVNFETMEFLAVCLPLTAAEEAARIMKRIDAGESFDAILSQYAAAGPQYVLRSAIENNPSSAKFQNFWKSASGAEKGEILGPLYLPSYQRMSQDEQGRTRVETQPEAWLVLRVESRTPQSPKTLEEAKPDLAHGILVGKELEKLRKDHKVEIYEDKFEDPAMYRDPLT